MDEFKKALEQYHDGMANDIAHFILDHFESVKGYVPYGFHGYCKEKVLSVINELMDQEGELPTKAEGSDNDL